MAVLLGKGFTTETQRAQSYTEKIIYKRVSHNLTLFYFYPL